MRSIQQEDKSQINKMQIPKREEQTEKKKREIAQNSNRSITFCSAEHLRPDMQFNHYWKNLISFLKLFEKINWISNFFNFYLFIKSCID